MKISTSTGPVTNTTLTNLEYSFEDFCNLLVKPEIGQKDGSYFIRGAFSGGSNTRSDKNIPRADLIVIDADSSIDSKMGQITSGAPNPELAHTALSNLGLQHVIFTTHSHGSKKGNRYRIALPCELETPVELQASVYYLITALQTSGVLIAPVKENMGWSQPWFFPRVQGTDSEYIFLSQTQGKAVNVTDCMHFFELSQIKEAKQNPPHHDPHSPISKFNQQNSNAEYMLKILADNDYLLMNKPKDISKTTYRLLSPHSTSQAPGILLFKSDDGQYRGISFHGEGDPLSSSNPTTGKRRAFSAFDLYRIFEHNGDAKKAIKDWFKDNDHRPTIQITADQLSQNLRATVDALGMVDLPIIFQRGQQLVRVAHLEDNVLLQGCSVPSGSVVISEIQKGLMQVKLQETIKWEKYSKQETRWMPSDPCPKITTALLEGSGEWGKIPTLLGISEVPILTPQGDILASRGYDHRTKLYIEGSFQKLTIPENPTRDDAIRAMEILFEPFQEFPFVDKELDKSVALSYILTLILRPQLPLAPLFCFSSTTPGTGKGLMVELANLMVRGRDAAIMPPVSGNSAEEETRKRITALLLQGIPSINLDNWTTAIGGEAMNTLLTATEWTDRKLGVSESVRLPSRITWSATGNNLSVLADMTRRSLLVRLDAGEEHPEQREFKNPDVRQSVIQNRARYLSAIFTILKAFQLCTEKPNIKLLGRFEEWSRHVCWPIVWLGLPDPVTSQGLLKDADPYTDDLRGVLEQIYNLKVSSHFTAGDLIKETVGMNTNSTHNEIQQRLRTVLMEVASDKSGSAINNKKLGRYFSKNAGRIVSGYVLRQLSQSANTKSAKQYHVERVSI